MTKKLPPIRKNWDNYFMDMAKEASKRATCLRIGFGVGCVLVKDHDPIATGYNGSISGDAHCIDVGCDLVNDHCQRVVHAEANAVFRAAKRGVRLEGATAYVTLLPCINCFRALATAGITRIVYAKEYKRDPRIPELAGVSRISLEMLIEQKTCCPFHFRERIARRNQESCRCLLADCNPCHIERIGCGCDGSMDDGCFNCTPESHPRPECEALKSSK